ncbi:MAG: BrnT family toxin [Chlorobiaceae bacterium]
MIVLAPQTEILYCVAFVDRGEVRRVISLRRANRREVKHYVENLQAFNYPHANCGRGQGHYCGS